MGILATETGNASHVVCRLATPPGPSPVHDLVIDRIAFYVDDLNAAIDEMNRLGFEQLGPIGGNAGGVGSIAIVFFHSRFCIAMSPCGCL